MNQFSQRIVYIIVALLPSLAFSQTDSLRSIAIDSLQEKKDSAKFFSSSSLGSLLRASTTVSSQGFLWKDYRHIGNFLEETPGFFLYDLGSAGQPHLISLNAMDATTIGFFFDGRPMNEPLTGQYDIHLFPTEMLERIEYIQSPRSFLAGMNANAAAINIISKSYDAKRPYTRIFYSEGAYEEGLFDGVFAQNILRNMNLNFGVQRRSTDGRFENTFDDEWNVRSKLRWNVSEKLNLQISQLYTKQKTGLFHGINPDVSEDIFDPNFAIVVDNVARQNILRWDWTLNGEGFFFDDSLSMTSFVLYTSSMQREFSVQNIALQKIKNDYRSAWSGVFLRQQLHYGNVSFDVGTNAEKRFANISDTLRTMEENYFSIFANATFLFSENIHAHIFGKDENYLQRNRLSSGVQINFYTHQRDELFLGYQRKSYQFPTLLQFINGNMPDGAYDILNAGFCTSSLRKFSAGFSFKYIMYFWSNQKLYENFSPNIFVHYRMGKFWAQSSAQMGGEYLLQKAKISGATELQFRDNYFNNNLELQFGLKSKYFLFENFYVPPFPGVAQWIIDEQYQNGTVDFLFFAHIGDAIVHFAWENLFDTQYYIVPFYPMPDRNLRIGVTWEFLN
mgnify:CR=1 FL=1